MCGTPPGGRLTDGKIEVAGLHSCVPHLVQHDPTSIPPINIACVFPAIEDAEDAIDELLLLSRLAEDCAADFVEARNDLLELVHGIVSDFDL